MFRRTIVWLSAVLALYVITGSRPVAQAAESISVASFNVQFVGHFKNRDNAALAKLMAPHDLIFIQELVAPPVAGVYPGGTPYKADNEAKAFVDAMTAEGFSYLLSEEDTGTGEKNHKTSSATEWFIAFYRPATVLPAPELASGFLAADRSDHPDYERVPYAFPFRAGAADLVFISVHLQPGGGSKDTARRAHELAAIHQWVAAQPGPERDYVILGDMNIEDCEELANVLAPGFKSLNHDCRATNTNSNGPKPYDHVMYNTEASAAEIDTATGLEVIDLVDAMRAAWPPDAGPYPGDPYDHKGFRTRYSDHNPVVFKIRTGGPDDD